MCTFQEGLGEEEKRKPDSEDLRVITKTRAQPAGFLAT